MTRREPQILDWKPFYILQATDINDPEGQRLVTNVLTTAIENAIVDVRVIAPASEGTPAHGFLQTLADYPSLQFRVTN